ncbi:unnamed protein product [Angiostrongylus costaricensis]|uniref:SRCR domain-containing protein n=1 Tax=Angiostrongylus costaricensis TaxID=334426 RepID=A0A0R3PBZ2_ANGCS|nr:unnamed protein product [Angiostrongylus costaricensis]
MGLSVGCLRHDDPRLLHCRWTRQQPHRNRFTRVSWVELLMGNEQLRRPEMSQ